MSSDKCGTYSAKDGAAKLGVSLDTFYDGVRRGQIPSIKIGKNRIRIPKLAFDRLLEEGSGGATTYPKND